MHSRGGILTGRTRGCYHVRMAKQKLTIRDIASACGVSIATVSYVLNGREDQRISEETRNRILHYVHIMGYESSALARALATGRSGAVGLYLPGAARDGDCALRSLQLASALEPVGKTLRLMTDTCEHQQLRDLDALIAVDVESDVFYRIGNNCFFPLLSVDGCIWNLDLFYQIYDDFAAIARLAQRQLGADRPFFALRPYRNRELNEVICNAFSDVCLVREPAQLDAFLRGLEADAAGLALGPELAAQIRSRTGARVLTLAYDEGGEEAVCRGDTILLPLKKKCRVIVQLVLDTIARQAGEEHDVRVI